MSIQELELKEIQYLLQKELQENEKQLEKVKKDMITDDDITTYKKLVDAYRKKLLFYGGIAYKLGIDLDV